MAVNLALALCSVIGIGAYLLLYCALEMFIDKKIMRPLEGITLALRRAVTRSRLR